MKAYLLLAAVLLTGCASNSKFVANAKLDSNIPLVVTKQGTIPPNSAGGVDFRIDLTNTSNQTIKYVYLTVAAQNRVGDYMIDSIDGKKRQTFRITGPILPGANIRNGFGQISTYSNIWYNYDITCGGVVGIKITYMNGTEEEIKDPFALIENTNCQNANGYI